MGYNPIWNYRSYYFHPPFLQLALGGPSCAIFHHRRNLKACISRKSHHGIIFKKCSKLMQLWKTCFWPWRINTETIWWTKQAMLKCFSVWSYSPIVTPFCRSQKRNTYNVWNSVANRCACRITCLISFSHIANINHGHLFNQINTTTPDIILGFFRF